MRNIAGPVSGNVFKGITNAQNDLQSHQLVRTTTDRNQYNNIIVGGNPVLPLNASSNQQRGGIFFSQNDKNLRGHGGNYGPNIQLSNMK